MKIVSWNCAGALRKKFSMLSTVDADVHVIQECENPSLVQDEEFKLWASNFLWVGDNKNKGLAVIAKQHIKLEALNWDSQNLQLFLPCKLNKDLTLLAVWTKEANSPNFKYIGQLWKYLQLHLDKLKVSNAILIGDLNSNTRWDEWDRWWNHSDVVKMLSEVGLTSLYHTKNVEEQGKESLPTFYMNRNLSKPYHIDYAFLSSGLVNASNISIGNQDKWLEFSDHMPLVVDIQSS